MLIGVAMYVEVLKAPSILSKCLQDQSLMMRICTKELCFTISVNQFFNTVGKRLWKIEKIGWTDESQATVVRCDIVEINPCLYRHSWLVPEF